jgi:carbonic anhydrase/acetyltransferase-like protein (isoleucine patch superfamily)
MGPLYAFEGKMPVVHPNAWVAPTAAVIGDVEIAEGANIWYHCVLRGDTTAIRCRPPYAEVSG